MTLHVQWSQIEAECDGYREGFVAIFRKYEGMPTDEKDAQGRTVKVTRASFSQHVGIPRQTFDDWVRKQDAGGQRPARDRTRESIQRMPAEDKAKLAAELLDDPEVEVAPSAIAKQASRPDVARAIARHDNAREAVEEEAIQHRARHMPDDLPEPRAAGRRAGDSMARKLDTDLAVAALRAAAGNLAEAILCKEEFGIRNPAEETEALTRLDHLRAAYASDAAVSDDDRGWLESIGVEL